MLWFSGTDTSSEILMQRFISLLYIYWKEGISHILKKNLVRIWKLVIYSYPSCKNICAMPKSINTKNVHAPTEKQVLEYC